MLKTLDFLFILNYMKRRPAFYFSILFSSGILFQNILNVNIFWYLAAIIVFSILIYYKKNTQFICLIVVFAGAVDFIIYSHLNKPLNITPGEYIIQGKIIEKIEYVNLNRYILKTISFDKKNSKFILYCKKDFDYGDIVNLRGNISDFKGVRIPYGLNRKVFYGRKGISGFIKNPGEIEVLEKRKGSWFYRNIVYALKDKIDIFLNKNFNKTHAAVLSGLILGKKEKIESDIIENFRKTGLAHILAISGLHTGFIFLILHILSQLFRLRHNYNYIFIVSGLVFYAILTGLKPSVLRAVIFLIIFTGAKILQRREDLLNTLGAAAFLILLFDPVSLFSVSFQLSFAAVLGIIIFTGFFKGANLIKKEKSYVKRFLKKYILLTVIISVGVTTAIAPIQGFYFNQIPLTGLLLNILIIPLTGIIVSLGIFVISIGLMLSITISEFTISLMFFLELLIKTASFSSKYLLVSIPVSRPDFVYLVLAEAAIAAILYFIYVKRYKLVILTLTVSLNLFIYISIYKTLNKKCEILFFDVGQGDSALISTPDGTNILIDTGINFSPTYYDYHRFFTAKGIRNINYLILTHRHSDHIGQAAEIMENVNVKHIISLPLDTKYMISAKIDSIRKIKNIPFKTITSGDLIKDGDNWRMYFLHPDTTGIKNIKNENNRSIVFKFVYKNLSVLFTGDIEGRIEKRLLSYGDFLKSRILKFPHHGSGSSGNREFLSLINPEFTIISVGEGNKYDFPSGSVMNILGNTGSKIYRTDLNGSIFFKYDGEELKAETTY